MLHTHQCCLTLHLEDHPFSSSWWGGGLVNPFGVNQEKVKKGNRRKRKKKKKKKKKKKRKEIL